MKRSVRCHQPGYRQYIAVDDILKSNVASDRGDMPDKAIRCESCGLRSSEYSQTWIAGTWNPERITVGLCDDCFWREHRRHAIQTVSASGGVLALLAGFLLLLFFIGNWKSQSLRFGLTIPTMLGLSFLFWLFYGQYARSLKHKVIPSEIPDVLRRFGLVKMREAGYSQLYAETEWEQVTGKKIASILHKGPFCCRCAKPLELERQDLSDPLQRVLPMTFLGTVCKICRTVECYRCRGGVGLPCSKCGGDISPAYQKLFDADGQTGS